MCNQLDVDYLVIKPCSDTANGTLNAPHEKYGMMEDLLRKAEKETRSGYRAVVKWNKMNNCGEKDYDVCYGTPFLLQISGDGTVFPCGHFFSIRRNEFEMGNLIQQSFKDIIHSDRYWMIQEKMKTLNVHKDCETNCRHYYLNQFLFKIKNPPNHINFI